MNYVSAQHVPIPFLAPSQYTFHPIDNVDMVNNAVDGEPNDDLSGTEITCFVTLSEDEDAMETEQLNPYPASIESNEEIEDLISLGNEWKWFLEAAVGDHGLASASTTTPRHCKMSTDGTMISESTDDDTVDSVIQDDECLEATYVIEEDEEIRRRRNELWKQSLKPCMFAERPPQQYILFKTNG